jgi:hypothetical protein
MSGVIRTALRRTVKGEGGEQVGLYRITFTSVTIGAG